MIKFNNSDVIDWNFDDSNIIKVYHNGAIVFYKFDSEQGGYKVCYAVVDDITQYSDREFEDVFDKATEKWYKLNNLNQYEQYGVYASGRNVTTYEGKLTIDGTQEYEWNGSSWVNLGEVSGSSRVPDGYVELTHVQTIKQQVSTSSAFTVPIDLQTYYNYIFEFTPIDWEGNNGSYYGILLGGQDGGTVYPKYGLFKFDNGWGTMWKRFSTVFWNYNLENRNSGGAVNKYRVYDNVRAKFTLHLHNYDVSQGADLTVENEGYEASAATSTLIFRSNYTVSTGTYNLPLFSTVDGNLADTAYIKCHELKVETSGGTAVYDYIPCKRESDNKVGLYDIVNNQFYAPLFTLDAGDEASHTEYPKYYSEKSEPLDNLTFSTLAEAQAYAEANCVYDGMHATINGDRYYFDSSDDNGWVKILEYYKVEDVTPGGASGWTITGSSTYNPQPSYYDDFSVALNSSYQTKVAKVTIYGYENFTYYLRSTGYSNYAYATSSNVDELTSDPTSMSYSSSSAITNTYNFNKAAGSAVNLSNYRRVTYNNLDKTVEHTFYVVFYDGYYTSSYPPSATLLIPKEQTNENWEQVTFSASSNVASAQKSLYIDGNYSTSGGTQYFYYRWMLGLPSGSHSSYTNYSNYSYCPNVTSSTFTSVAGEQRQVNFTYDNTSNKTLSFRLTDGSNVLTPSDTVYFDMTYYNSCGVSSSSTNVTFPRSQSVKVGGRFRFANSSNRHYIYGYSPNISLNTNYYVDNYQSTFDITYAKLSEEAVTVTYTTYDPSDAETPLFKTDITWPYNGGTTSSTTLTSYAVPYTYPYEVSQTNNKFSADSQTYTAGQSSRTINFVLYPNNREFATVADMEAYAYAWEGMKATVGDTKYKYENGEWVENQHSLPDVPFVLNYNARQYNASTHTIPYTEGALNAIDAVITGTTANIIDHSSDGYIELTGSTSTPIRALVGTTNFSRSSSSPNITIICKAYTPGSSTEGNILSNRRESYNWMYRHKSSILTFHGTSEQGSIAVSNTVPNTCSIRIDSNRLLKYNNWTQNTTSTYSNFNYGSNSNGGALFSGYYSNSGEHWKGVFYWIYMSLNTLTDEQVQQVIDYNENL